jgi:hypothetical protein
MTYMEENLFRIRQNSGHIATALWPRPAGKEQPAGKITERRCCCKHGRKDETMNQSIQKSIFIIVLTMSAISFGGTYGGGTGTAGNPYQISTVVHWQELINTPSDWNKQFVLTADIDFGGINLTPVAPDVNNSTWQYEGTAFTGYFDGHGHTLRNIVINLPNNYYVGLFGCLGPNSEIRNLKVESVQISGKRYVGGLAGSNGNVDDGPAGRITGCSITGIVMGTWCYVGGLVGENVNQGTITFSCTLASVSGGSHVGGLVGVDSGAITACCARGAVMGTDYVGGLVGFSSYDTVTAGYATGSVSGNQPYVGGLVGYKYGGHYNGGNLYACFWDKQTTGQEGSAGGKGLTTHQMRTMAIFQNAGWGERGWVMEDGVDMPRLPWEIGNGIPIPAAEPIPLAGSGTQTDPYQVWTPTEFALLSWYASVLDKYMVLMSDLNMAGILLYPIGDLGPFSGVFDGNRHALHNVAIYQPNSDYVGVFTYLDRHSHCQVKNLMLKDSAIEGRSDVGALAGYNRDGVIIECSVTGTVSGKHDVGGLVGQNGNLSTIGSSCAVVDVSGSFCVGGLVGYAYYGTVTDSYSQGSVTGHTDPQFSSGYLGGLCGLNQGSVSHSYATSYVTCESPVQYIGGLCGRSSGTITDCFWDIQTSGQTTSAGGIGKTTAQMKMQSTFTNAGWDFVNMWWMPVNDYPKLVWQRPLAPLISPMSDQAIREGFSFVSVTPSLVQGTQPIQWELINPPNPNITIDSQTGVVRWNQPIARTEPYQITIRASNVAGSDEKSWNLTVLPGLPCYSGGSGTEADPFKIATPDDLIALGNTPADYSKYFILTADIDLAGNIFSQAVIAPDTDSASSNFQGTSFAGIFDGNGHVISNLTINTTENDYVALFGQIVYRGQVKNFGMVNAIIQGRRYVGGLVGRNYDGTITSCYVTGTVNGTDSYVGGLVGWNLGSGTITSCYATVTMTGDYCVGGLCGTNWGIINNCYSTGNVSGTSDYVGGLVGDNISGSIYSCFWDSQTSGQVNSSGGRGLTTEKMKTMSVFQNAGWADKGWIMNDGEDFPRLMWEGIDGVPIPAALPIPLAGSGTATDPYQIVTTTEFALLSWYSSVLNKHIILMADLDLRGEVIYPIGDMGQFTGVFDGNGHVLRNVVINHPSENYVGLFSINFGGCIKMLGIVNANIQGRGDVGGLCGMNRGTISDCYTTGTVSGKDYGAGGLVGWNFEGTIISCYSTATVKGDYYVGGLCGYNWGMVSNCYATGDISGAADHVGGLVGWNNGPVGWTNDVTITSCYALGTVKGEFYVGGLVGSNEGRGTITSCYATGAVSGNKYYVGGLLGGNDGSGTITSCYATGMVTGGENVGGLCGTNGDTISSSFWDIQTSGQMTSAGEIGRAHV